MTRLFDDIEASLSKLNSEKCESISSNPRSAKLQKLSTEPVHRTAYSETGVSNVSVDSWLARNGFYPKGPPAIVKEEALSIPPLAPNLEIFDLKSSDVKVDQRSKDTSSTKESFCDDNVGHVIEYKPSFQMKIENNFHQFQPLTNFPVSNGKYQFGEF